MLSSHVNFSTCFCHLLYSFCISSRLPSNLYKGRKQITTYNGTLDGGGGRLVLIGQGRADPASYTSPPASAICCIPSVSLPDCPPICIRENDKSILLCASKAESRANSMCSRHATLFHLFLPSDIFLLDLFQVTFQPAFGGSPKKKKFCSRKSAPRPPPDDSWSTPNARQIYSWDQCSFIWTLSFIWTPKLHVYTTHPLECSLR